jgi:hypothetical protein
LEYRIDYIDSIFLEAWTVVAALLYETEAEERQHLSAICMLARDLGIAEDSIRPLYENELRGFKEHVPRINLFLLLSSFLWLI